MQQTGSTHSGLGEWLVQRLSALYMTVFLLSITVFLFIWPPAEYAALKSWFTSGFIRVSVALFFLSLVIHAWIGMRSVFMDYLKPFWVRFMVTTVTGFGLLIVLLWLIRLVLITE